VTIDLTTAREEVLHELRGGEKFLLTTHENPDGDALGSLVAMNEILIALSKDTVMFLSAEEFPLPYEYRDLPLGSVSHSLPEDAGERTIVFLDCGNLDRMPVSFLSRDDAHIVNIDHHHDNTRFGTANLVVDGASCTAEILWELLPDLGVDLTPAIAEALYIGLVTDTGKFQYEATTPETLRIAARLREHPFDHARLAQALYEDNPAAYLQLVGVALGRLEHLADADLVWTYLTQADLQEAGVHPAETDDLIDVIRTARDVDVAAIVKQQKDGRFKVSVRSRGGHDLAKVAEAFGGGGHRLAAGYTSAHGPAETAERLAKALRGEPVPA
jgi:phosphoesterase RecJ-like protein